MKMTDREKEMAKRATRRFWCPHDRQKEGQHQFAPTVIAGKLGKRCTQCGHAEILSCCETPENLP